MVLHAAGNDASVSGAYRAVGTTWLCSRDVCMAGLFFAWNPAASCHEQLPASKIKLLGEQTQFAAIEKTMVMDADVVWTSPSSDEALVRAGRVSELCPSACHRCGSENLKSSSEYSDHLGLVTVSDLPHSQHFMRRMAICQSCVEEGSGRSLRVPVRLEDIRRCVPTVLALSMRERGSEGGRWPLLVTVDYAMFAMDVSRDNFCIKERISIYAKICSLVIFGQQFDRRRDGHC